jgi:hypothetical protein
LKRKNRDQVMTVVKVTTCTYVRLEVFMAVIMKNAVFWDVTFVRTDVSEECIASIIRL